MLTSILIALILATISVFGYKLGIGAILRVEAIIARTIILVAPPLAIHILGITFIQEYPLQVILLLFISGICWGLCANHIFVETSWIFNIHKRDNEYTTFKA